jgi:hypothetical protein
MSAIDIERGARWSTDLAVELEKTGFGILCLTPENLESTWIHFEAGALSKTLEKTFLCPYLFEVEPIDLKGPLVQFNSAKAHKEDTKKLVLTINAAQDSPLPKTTIEESFEVWWPKLEESLNKIPAPKVPIKTERPLQEMVEEILELAREQARKSRISQYSNDLAELESELAEDSIHFESNFPIGTWVRHQKYGVGRVVERDGKGDGIKLTIIFHGYGTRKMLQKYAGLQRA